MKNKWNYNHFNFNLYDFNTRCEVLTEKGDIFIAYCYKHYPGSDQPEVWEDDWITDDERIDEKNGRLIMENAVVAWRVLQ